jgi:hypothetical protein
VVKCPVAVRPVVACLAVTPPAAVRPVAVHPAVERQVGKVPECRRAACPVVALAVLMEKDVLMAGFQAAALAAVLDATSQAVSASFRVTRIVQSS